MTDYKVQSGNNMPMQAPLIPDPFVPYRCPDNATLSVFCRTDRAVLDDFLAPTPFEAAGDIIVAYAADFTRCDKIPFMDGGIIVPVIYEGTPGGYFLFEYEDNDAAIAAGRDLALCMQHRQAGGGGIEQVAVGDLHALGSARGSGGVNHVGQVLRRGRPRQVLGAFIREVRSPHAHRHDTRRCRAAGVETLTDPSKE